MNSFNPFKISKAILGGLLLALPTCAADLPTASEIAQNLSFGWNLGNTMEVPGDPTAWGNSIPTQSFIDSLHAAGINTIRIPCAWDSYADQNTLEISSTWMAQVKEVVDFAINREMYVILNIHWDGGWLEMNIGNSVDAGILQKQKAYWGQIAEAFKDYDEHLLFASANEPAHADPYGTAFGQDRVDVLNAYHQAMIDTVRVTGGNNGTRTIIVQCPRTDPELFGIWNPLPTDPTPGRLMTEFHFYPYNFTLMEADETWGNQFYYWGQGNHSTTDAAHNPTWGEEDYIDALFGSIKTNYADKGIPVILGEFGAILRTTLTGADFTLHKQSREAFYKYVAQASKANGIIPYAWDTGFEGNKQMTIFNRDGSILDLGLLNALRTGWGMNEYIPGEDPVIDPVDPVDPTSKSLHLSVNSNDSTWAQINLGVEATDFSTYESITVRAYFSGDLGLGYANFNLVTMSDNWTWKEASIGTPIFDQWNEYTIPIGASGLDPANPALIDFFALQMYSDTFRGDVYIDYIRFNRANGTTDTLYTFDSSIPTGPTGDFASAESVLTSSVASVDNPVDLAQNLKNVPLFHTQKIEGALKIHFAQPLQEPTQIQVFRLNGELIETLDLAKSQQTGILQNLPQGPLAIAIRSQGGLSQQMYWNR